MQYLYKYLLKNQDNETNQKEGNYGNETKTEYCQARNQQPNVREKTQRVYKAEDKPSNEELLGESDVMDKINGRTGLNA